MRFKTPDGKVLEGVPVEEKDMSGVGGGGGKSTATPSCHKCGSHEHSTCGTLEGYPHPESEGVYHNDHPQPIEECECVKYCGNLANHCTHNCHLSKQIEEIGMEEVYGETNMINGIANLQDKLNELIGAWNKQ